jgi:predicted nucleic acid-binding protein
MAAYFFDTSALAKRYVTEIGTPWVQSVADPAAQNRLYVVRITLVELVSAITRRKKNGDLTSAIADPALASLRSKFDSDYDVIEVTSVLVSRAEALAEKHALRGYDAVQLAAAVQVYLAYVAVGQATNQPLPILISADIDLNMAAQAEGRTVDDPNTH